VIMASASASETSVLLPDYMAEQPGRQFSSTAFVGKSE
jgi:hypothetical protein